MFLKNSAMKTNWLLLVHHDPVLDPRIDWICRHCPKGINISTLAYFENWNTGECGIMHNSHTRKYKEVVKNFKFDTAMDYLADELESREKESLQKPARIKAYFETAFQLLCFSIRDTNLSAQPYLKQKESKNEMAIFASKIKYLYECSRGLIAYQSYMEQRPSGIIASDFYTLFAGVYLKLLWDCPLIYEAHEYFSEEVPNVPNNIRSFWKTMEMNLCRHTNKRFIVTKELGNIAKKELGLPFIEMLNAVPFADPI